MKTAIFLDQATSYHPLKAVIDTLKKPLHPHCQSPLFQNKELFLQSQNHLEVIRDYFGAKKGSGFIAVAGGEQAIARVFDLHYHKEMFHSGKQHILVAKTDKSLCLSSLEKLKPLGVCHDYLEVNAEGHITQEMLSQAITPRTSLVMLSWANPLTGIIQPISDIAKLCHERGVSCFVDVSHVIGKLYFNLEDVNIDYMTFDAKPFHGPYQVGGIALQNQDKISSKESLFPLQLEALEQSLFHAKDTIDTMNLEIARLRNTFERKISEKIPSAKVLFQDVERLPHVSVIVFPGVASEYLLYLLAQDLVYASTLEDVLSDMHIEASLAKCALSFSLSYQTTQEELEKALEVICKHYNKAKELFLEGV